MTRVFLADSQPEGRSALRLLLLDLNMQVVGEAADWATVLNEAAGTQPDMVVVDWELIPADSSLPALRATYPAAVVIVLISHLDPRQQAALSAGANIFISKSETPDRVAERLLAAAKGHNQKTVPITAIGPV
jgi:DNA-binding NarL/FixJ family response regulator